MRCRRLHICIIGSQQELFGSQSLLLPPACLFGSLWKEVIIPLSLENQAAGRGMD